MPEHTRQLFRYAGLPARAARLALSDPATALLAVRMGAWVVALSLLIRLMPLPRVLSLVAPKRKGGRVDGARTDNARAGEVRTFVAQPDDVRTDEAQRTQAALARLLDSLLATDFWVFTPTCWKRAPVLHRYLALKGIETRILFGVRRDGEDALSGHAWLEAGGQPLLEKTPPDYKVTYSFPS
jgi:hypothetical protein